MNARLVLPPLAAAVALALVAALQPSAGAAATAPVTAPVPLRTRPADEVCDAWSVAHSLCEASEAMVEARYACYADPDVSASRGTHPFFPDVVLWTVHSYGFHGCPDRSGDPVRVVGALEALFNGEVVAAEICGDLGSCTTSRTNAVLGYQYAFAVAIATTTTYSDVAGTVTGKEYFVWT